MLDCPMGVDLHSSIPMWDMMNLDDVLMMNSTSVALEHRCCTLMKTQWSQLMLREVEVVVVVAAVAAESAR